LILGQREKLTIYIKKSPNTGIIAAHAFAFAIVLRALPFLNHSI